MRLLQAAGFEEAQAAAVLRAAFGYALGCAAIELSSLSSAPGAGDGDAEFEAMARVSRAVCLADLDQQFGGPP